MLLILFPEWGDSSFLAAALLSYHLEIIFFSYCITVCFYLFDYYMSLGELCMWLVRQFPGHKHHRGVVLLWFEVNFPPSRLALPAFTASQAGMFICPPSDCRVERWPLPQGSDRSPVWDPASPILSQLTARITGLFPPRCAELPLLIKQAHSATFLAFFMCRLLPFFHMHG